MIPRLADLAVCPCCGGGLTWTGERASCNGCERTYPIVDGIPILLRDVSASQHDELEHHGAAHKRQQAGFFDESVAAEFEITRPHGTPRLYRWLLQEKFSRSVAGLEDWLRGKTALAVCAGSGMDAEFLARAGANVVASDISLGAMRRARLRALRYGLAIQPVVADVERLPFPDMAFDLTYVHDGLHHLEQPFSGLDEMARVAKGAISVTEPARAAATAVAIRLGLALEREEAGNRVARLMPEEVSAELARHGFSVLRAQRYAMYYKHEPGFAMRVLSSPYLERASEALVGAVNRLIGSWGNKLCVTAVRAG